MAEAPRDNNRVPVLLLTDDTTGLPVSAQRDSNGRLKASAVIAAGTSTQNVEVTKNSGAVIGTRKTLNFIEGSNVTLTIADDSIDGEVDITIAATVAAGANTALSNLASVALNTALLPDAAAADDFGSATLPFKDLFFAGSSATPGTNNFKLTGASAGGLRTITAPDASGTMTLLGNSSTGSGAVALATSPVFTTPSLGVATATSINKVALTAPATSCTITVANGKTLTASASITLAGTDGKTLTLSNNLTLTGTDGSSVAFGTGGTVAYTNVTSLTSLGTVSTALTGVLRADAGVLSADTDVTDLVSAASDSAAGKVELATAAETTTGTDTGRAVTPDGLAGSDFGMRLIEIQVVAAGTATAVGDGAGNARFFVPAQLNGYNLVSAHAAVITAGTTNTTDIQIANVTQTADMLTTKITIDSGEKTSYTAATGSVIDTNNDDVATGDEIRIDVDAISTTPAQGLCVILGFQLP